MNDAGRLEVNFKRCRDAHTAIERIISDLQVQLANLESDAAPLVSTWTGDAQLAYHQRQTSWHSSAQELTRILRGINHALEESLIDYQATENRAVRLFSG
jgi:WXG100 family type VII secretion target